MRLFVNCLFLFKVVIIIHGIAIIPRISTFKVARSEFKCFKQCVCASEYLSDVPIMKWLTIPMNKKSNYTRIIDNHVIDDQDDDIILDHNPLIFAAFCTQHELVHHEFSPAIEALTLLFGPDAANKTVKHELKEFNELLALDIQGYEAKSPSFLERSKVQLHYNALLELRNLRYLNIQYIHLYPFSNATVQDLSSGTYSYYLSNQPNFRQHTNITFLVPNDEEVIPYEEYKRRKSVVSTFSRCTDLQFLRLFHCHIDTITWDMFDGLSNLHMLSLQSNDITELPEYAFYGMPQLRSLVLSENKIQRIHDESLAGLFHLENLDLSGNRLKTLSDTTFAPLPKLYSLNLLGNPLNNVFASTFETVNKTRNLWISSTQSLTVFENAFSSLNELEKLIVLGLHTSTLQKEVLHGLTKLKFFRISGNVEYLTFDTFATSQLLEELVLRHCSLKSISVDAFYGLERLKRLDLSRNKLEILQPGVFDQLYSLKELILSHNLFATLPRMVLANLQRVDMIRLEANPWSCSCDMVDWGSLSMNKKKEIRTVEQLCNYQYDKIPCISVRTELYVYDAKAIPKCAAPTEYKGRNVLHIVYKKMGCDLNRALMWKKHSKITKNGRKRISSTSFEDPLKEDEVNQSTLTSPAATILPTNKIQTNDDVDNNLGDLSTFLGPNNNLY